MAKSMIIYGVPGGKTRFAQRIADHFGLKNHQAQVLRMYCEGSIGFVESEAAGKDWAKMGFETRSFQSVADEINASIPLTDWQSGPPPMVGEWNASRFGHEENRMWWNGKNWSLSWHPDDVIATKNNRARKNNPADTWSYAIQWRGLSQEPIKVTE